MTNLFNNSKKKMKQINIQITSVLGTDFFHYCYYNNILFHYSGYEIIVVTINEEFENELLTRITNNDYT